MDDRGIHAPEDLIERGGEPLAQKEASQSKSIFLE